MDSLRSANDVRMRVISSDATRQESHSDGLALGAQPVALALGDPSPSIHKLIVLGANNASAPSDTPKLDRAAAGGL